MRKRLTFNLARGRKVNGAAFAWRVAALLLAALLLWGAALANLARRLEAGREDSSGADLGARRLADMRQRTSTLRRETDSLRQKLRQSLARTNYLIERKAFSVVARLDFLEEALGPGVEVRHLLLENEAAGRVSMTLSSRSLKELFALYRKLAPYGLVIVNDTQSGDEYQVRLSFRIHDDPA
ncbi:MAG: hypothetical protein JXO51_06475 [Candidatus Aminicenantes bacterium]|nr:hypothetical protein [Candidatus Aminicenantes bacterium]